MDLDDLRLPASLVELHVNGFVRVPVRTEACAWHVLEVGLF